MIGDYLEPYTYQFLLEQALNQVPDNLDKREGSIIYDALAPACYELANYYMELRKMLLDAYVSTASEEYLELRVQEQGITRREATKAIRLGVFMLAENEPAVIPINSRFSTVDSQNSVIYKVIGPYKRDDFVIAGSYLLECETAGEIGNTYTGLLQPLSNINGLEKSEITSIITPAENRETDEHLRERYFQKVNNKSFGGNVSNYREELIAISGVGDCQIYPVWDGGGTVKCSIITSEYNTASEEFISQVQEMIDPDPQATGLGIAPIGHKVTITTATKKTINIKATITPEPSYSLDSLLPVAKQIIENYLLQLRQDWGKASELNEYSLSIYNAKIVASLITMQGVVNVSKVLINDNEGDLQLTETAELQELPVLGEVILNEP